jgi:DNA-binding winged helix-turn-helix (wHTH) protein
VTRRHPPSRAESSTIGGVSSRKEVRSSALPDFHVGGWLAQPPLNLIRDGATVRRLEPQVMDLLVFLAATAGRVVSKDEIIDAVWEGRFIAEATLTRSVADLRRALGDDQRSPRYIETIPKRGYRLVAAVSAGSKRPITTPAPMPAEARDPVDSGPVVLPFARPAREAPADQADTSPARSRIADRLASARRRRFVGRDAELDDFRSALLADEPAFVAMHIHGAGGVGKTTLLDEFARVATEAGRAVVRIDGRHIEASATGFLVALAQAIGAGSVEMPAVLERWPAGGVLLVDTFELLAPLDDWLRSTVLPQFHGHSLIVIAGRDEPATAWRTDVEWAPLTRVVRLGNLAPDDSRTYLMRCGVPAERQDEALAFTRGHPLALSLIADVLTRGNRIGSCRLDNEPEVVRLLLEKFVQDVPSRDHRLALHVCVTVWATTEPLLAAALGRADAHDLFEWLGHLPFIEHGPYGLFPHDLARDVVYADFRWRDPDMAYSLMERTISHLYGRLEHTGGLDRQRLWFDLLYVQRYNRALRPHFQWASFGTAYAETARASDHEAILDMVERHEGPASASIARYWLTRQPDAFSVMRNVGGDLIGFVANLRLDAVTADDLAADPAIPPILAYVERHGPMAPGEQLLLGRFWMDRERHQAVSQAFTLVAATCSQSWTTANLAWCFVAMAHPDLLEPMFTEIHIWRTPELDFEVRGHRYGVFAHDWRVETAQQWLRLKAERAWRADSPVASSSTS